MNWNKYDIRTDSGFKQEIVMGEWLKEGKYPFGEVSFIRTLTDTEIEEYRVAEDGIMALWYAQLPEEFYAE